LLQTDANNHTRPNIGAAPALFAAPKLKTNVEIAVLHEERMLSLKLKFSNAKRLVE
jgi:hypothetical protein